MARPLETLSVEQVLAARHRSESLSSRTGLGLSLLVHGALVAALLLMPLLTTAPPERLRFVSVALVSAQALGVPDPPPKSAAPEPQRQAQAPERKPAPQPVAQQAPPKIKTESPPPRSEPAPTSDAGGTSAAPPPELARRRGAPTGSTTGTAALGAKVGFDNPNFRHSYFVDRLTAMLAAEWQRPAIGGELAVLVHFTIRRDGAVTGVEIVESSGYSSYDLAALRAVQQAAPFPPLPQSYAQSDLGVTVEFI